MKMLLLERNLILRAERTTGQTLLLIGGVGLFVGLVVFSFFDSRVQLIEVAWAAIAAYGLTFDFLNLRTASDDRANSDAVAHDARRSVDEFTDIYLKEKVAAARKRVVALSMMLAIGVFAMLSPANPPNPDAAASGNVLAALFFVMGYCISSNGQDAWLSRRLQREAVSRRHGKTDTSSG